MSAGSEAGGLAVLQDLLRCKKLTAAKLPSYLSPSALIQYEKQPCTFFLERMIDDPQEREPQSMTAAVGSAFDYFIKIEIARNLGQLEELRDTLWKGIFKDEDKKIYQGKSVNDILWCLNVEPHNRAEAAPVGKLLVEIYKQNDFDINKFNEVEIHKSYMLKCNGLTVPIIGKGDAKYESYPFDWKVKGYGSAASPTPGYYSLWQDGINKGSHKKYQDDIPFDLISDRYATQLATYGWQSGFCNEGFVDFPAYIDELVIRGSNIRVAKYRGIITKSFQEKLAQRYANAWLELRNGSYVASLPQDRKLIEISAESETWY